MAATAGQETQETPVKVVETPAGPAARNEKMADALYEVFSKYIK